MGKTQVEIISYLESTILGDPFNFLANQDNGNWEFLCNCCVRSASQEEQEQDRYKIENLPSLVAESAKDKVHDTLQKRLAEEEKNQLESRLARMEILLNNLLEKMT